MNPKDVVQAKAAKQCCGQFVAAEYQLFVKVDLKQRMTSKDTAFPGDDFHTRVKRFDILQ